MTRGSQRELDVGADLHVVTNGDERAQVLGGEREHHARPVRGVGGRCAP